MYVLCFIIVTFMDGDGFRRDDLREVEGKVTRQSAEFFNADFSGHAKYKGYIGDYRQVTVPKSSCKVSK